MTSRDQLLNAQTATELQGSHLEMDSQDPHSRSGPKCIDLNRDRQITSRDKLLNAQTATGVTRPPLKINPQMHRLQQRSQDRLSR